jgi:hypothetical protein
MACSGRRRSGKRNLGHGAKGRPGPALRHGHWRRRARRTRTSKNLIGTSCASAYARAWQRAQSSACSLRIARPLLLIGGVCPGAASSEELAAGSESLLQNGQPGHVALMLQAPGKAAGSFLMAPGQVFASLAVAVVDAHRRATMRRRAQAWVRLRELVRKAACRFLTAPCEDFPSLAVVRRHLGSAGHISAEARRWHTLVALVVLGSPMPSPVESSSESDSDSDEADYREIDAQESWRSQPAIVSEGRLPLRQFQIFLSGVHGRTITLEVALDDTVDAVLSKIQDKEGVPWNGPHRLVYNCRTLQRHRTLADYGVCPDAALHLLWLPRGGGICMGKPTVVAPGENIAPQDAAPEAPRQTGASEPATTPDATRGSDSGASAWAYDAAPASALGTDASRATAPDVPADAGEHGDDAVDAEGGETSPLGASVVLDAPSTPQVSFPSSCCRLCLFRVRRCAFPLCAWPADTLPSPL